MAKFKCKLSGTIIELVHQADIDSMQGHEGYEPVQEKQKEEIKEEAETEVKIPKFRGK